MHYVLQHAFFTNNLPMLRLEESET